MSRIAKTPIIIPNDVFAKITKNYIIIKGKLGVLKNKLNKIVNIKKDSNTIKFSPNNNSKKANAISGTIRSLTQNMIIGVSKGFQKKLNLVCVGFRAHIKNNNNLELSIGFSHLINCKIPKNIVISTPTNSEIIIKGCDKQKVGQITSEIRSYRKPEPYKGKGIRYSNEVINIKETKKKQ